MSELIILNKDQKHLDDMCNKIMLNQRKYNIEELQNSVKKIYKIEKCVEELIQENEIAEDLLKISYHPKQTIEQPDFQSYYNKVTQLEKIVEELRSKDEREDIDDNFSNENMFNNLNEVNVI